MTLSFSAKISSVTSHSLTDTTTIGAGGSGTGTPQSAGGSGSGTDGPSGTPVKASASLAGSFANKKTSANSNTENREFSLTINVHAVQDAMPAGMAKVLAIFEECILRSVVH